MTDQDTSQEPVSEYEEFHNHVSDETKRFVKNLHENREISDTVIGEDPQDLAASTFEAIHREERFKEEDLKELTIKTRTKFATDYDNEGGVIIHEEKPNLSNPNYKGGNKE